MRNVLVVDDELSIRESFSLILEDRYRVLQAASGEAALKSATDQKIDIIYLDIRMPGMDGIETLKRLKQIDPALEIIMVTAVNDVQKASQAVKLGARDYIVKPFDVNNVLRLTDQILKKRSILAEGMEIQKKTGRTSAELVGQHEKIAEILKTLEKTKEGERILIIGEKGTEKEVIARLTHEKSGRADLPFRTLSLSRSTGLLEIKSLLFGREKGSTTADLEARTGLLEQTREGTLFMDNLQALPEEVFRTIAESHFSRIDTGFPSRETGGSAKIPIETRLIGGAEADLSASRNEIFKFFCGTLVHIPPLRERGSDIPLLANHFLGKYNSLHGRELKLDPFALEALVSYDWPGNTEELESLIERLVLSSSEKEITADALPLNILLKSGDSGGSGFIPLFETEYVRRAFEKSGRNKERTAAFLGINPALLETKI